VGPLGDFGGIVGCYVLLVRQAMGKVLGLALRDQQPLGVAAGVFSNLQN